MSENIVSEIICKYTDAELVQICKVLNKEYNIYDPDEVRWKKISFAFFRTEPHEIDALKRFVSSNELINDLLVNYYICERVVKYHFIRQMKDLAENIVAFEMNVGDSRIDICRINGCSYAYEIKTEYDNFDRLESQMADYTKAFERVYVIVPKDKATAVAKHIPDTCGIISYRANSDHQLVFSYMRKSQTNICDIEFCLKNLSGNDMSTLLSILGESVQGTKSEKLDFLIKYSMKNSIWKAYRMLLKTKYCKQWGFLKTHFNDILPIDLQSFFSTGIDPSIIY